MTLEEEVAAFLAELARGRTRARTAWEFELLANIERDGRAHVVRLEMQRASDRMREAAERIRASTRRT